jgi:hypothetical protein
VTDGRAALVLTLVPFLALGAALAPGLVLAPVDLLQQFPPFAAPGAPPPANPLLFDAAFIFQPWQLHAGAEIAAGRWPLWNPFAFAGAPFFANPQSALLFPLTLTAVVLPAALALTLASLMKLVVAGLAAYWCFRTLGIASRAALFGALVYQGSAVLSVWLEWSYGNAIAVLPLLFGAVERLRTRPGLRPVAWLALAVMLEVVAGYPQLAALGVVVAVAWAIVRGAGDARSIDYLGRLSLGLALGAALAAVQVLPFVEYLEQSSVLFYRRQWTPIVTPPARTAIALLMPWYYGAPGSPAYWGYSNFNEIAASVGLLPWLLVPVAAILGWRRPGTRFFLALAAFALAGFYRLPLLGDVLTRVPFASQRVLPFLALALAALSAIALDALGAAPSARRRRSAIVMLGAGVVLIWIAFAAVVDDAGWLVRHAVAPPVGLQLAACVALLAIGACLLARMHRPAPADDRTFAALVLVQLVATVPMTVTPRAITDTSLLYPWTPALRHLAAAAVDGARVALPTKNLGALYGLRDVVGYDGMTPRRIEEVASPAADLGLFGNSALSITTAPGSAVFDLLAFRRALLAPGAAPPVPHATIEYDGPDARVIRNERAQPRAFVVHGARCAAGAGALPLLHAGAVDLRSEVILAACDAVTPRPSAPPGPSDARITHDGADRVVLDVAAAADGWLVLTDTWFPGWRVTVDGRDARVLRANHAFRAVAVTGGRHVVEFRYRPPSVLVGLVVSLLAGVGTIVCAASPGRAGPRTAWLGAVIIALIALGGLAAIVIAMDPDAGQLPPPLPGTPFSVDVRPAALVEGAPAQLRIAPRAIDGERPIDIYVARIPGGAPSVSLLSPDGRWSPAAVPLARGVTARTPPIEVGWTESGPVGWSTLVIVPVHASRPPTRRESWAARPVLLTLRVRATPAPPGPGVLLSVCGAIAAVGTCVAVVVGLRWSRSPARSD